MSDTVSHKIHKALKVRLYPSEEQKVILNKTFGCCRVVYSERLAEHINYYNCCAWPHALAGIITSRIKRMPCRFLYDAAPQ